MHTGRIEELYSIDPYKEALQGSNPLFGTSDYILLDANDVALSLRGV